MSMHASIVRDRTAMFLRREYDLSGIQLPGIQLSTAHTQTINNILEIKKLYDKNTYTSFKWAQEMIAFSSSKDAPDEVVGNTSFLMLLPLYSRNCIHNNLSTKHCADCAFRKRSLVNYILCPYISHRIDFSILYYGYTDMTSYSLGSTTTMAYAISYYEHKLS